VFRSCPPVEDESRGIRRGGGGDGCRRNSLRLEARDTLSQLKPLVGPGVNTMRNDLTLSAGLLVRF